MGVLDEDVIPVKEPYRPVTEVNTSLNADVPPFIRGITHDDGLRYDLGGEYSNDVLADTSVHHKGGEYEAPMCFPPRVGPNEVDVTIKPPLARSGSDVLSRAPLPSGSSNRRIFQGSDSDEDIEVSDPYNIPAVPAGDSAFGDKHTQVDSIKEGWVWKQSRYLKRWRRRWIVLTPRNLQTYRKRSDTKPTEIIKEGAVTHCGVPESDVTHNKTFCIGADKRTFVMVSDTEAEKDEWIENISKALKK